MTSFSQKKTYIDVLRTERVNHTLCLVGLDPNMSKNAFNPRDLSQNDEKNCKNQFLGVISKFLTIFVPVNTFSAEASQEIDPFFKKKSYIFKQLKNRVRVVLWGCVFFWNVANFM